MNLEGILAIGGKPGLYNLVAQSRGGVIVEHLTTNKRLSIGAQAQVSALQDIAIFTWDEEKPLAEIFQAMMDKHGEEKSISPKSSSRELEDYFAEILPDYDTDRVYPSDIKKVVSWYNMLHETGHLTMEAPEEESKEEETK
ncbi:DUF5606 family protein [Phaeocystidibacter luteus]|uniref:Uncharacterized protein n=1 Tax=Phaeocystidibacter luteus TaxID=911197 RepID=A0A6N6RMV5_9FLAO|nr:DUF5606 domain-containing protein [Phaeocystidibacter luteus]KAB2814878.1 hypothetical protein F8C67_03770 [Phaeocystidibacter luteus]